MFIDLGFEGPRFTWCNNKKAMAWVWEQLGHTFALNAWLQLHQDIRV